MSTNESDAVKYIREASISYPLLKLIHHEMGNGLAVLCGYRHRLQRAILEQEQEVLPSTRDVWQDRNEQWLGYLQKMQDREIRMKDLLVQLRELVPGARDEPLCKNFVRTDLVVLLGRVIEQRVPLYPDPILQAIMPTQSLFIMCEPFWLEVILEHILNYIVAQYTNTTPTEVYLEPFPNNMGREAKITFRIRRDLPRRASGIEERFFEAQLRVLDQGEPDVCAALCNEILHEHGGRIWSEQEGTISLALPLAEEREDML
ncbi:hypothetical protein KSD_38450 [Ktedonobacter sp. SOSP1-85]|uniref:HAMP domain-containing histidine kinase n=1 Tax=Ktedonobacter sp. SOSP1-85 TaxID=2778367 RepID=UPI001915C19A|nr:HAMP domain-containing histidine kinase [Ktedonobacter sp. SOSP1-85]GHO76074.1 hypothetical protein KSD_38450 [Ktedonobacter sp. SOSP1-85]